MIISHAAVNAQLLSKLHSARIPDLSLGILAAIAVLTRFLAGTMIRRGTVLNHASLSTQAMLLKTRVLCAFSGGATLLHSVLLSLHKSPLWWFTATAGQNAG